MSELPKKRSPFITLAAGCVAGAIEAMAVWPMEFIKTQLQLSPKGSLPYNGMLSGFRHTITSNGFLSLYRGLLPTLIGSMPKAGIRFSLNSQLKENLRDNEGNLTMGKNFFAGMGAGIGEAIIVVAPVETIKTRCIELDKSFLEGLKFILKKEGIGGVYLGAFATALKQGSNQGLRFMWFNEYKRVITNDGEKKITPLFVLFGGMSAGCFSTLGNNPLDVVKTRMQGTKALEYKDTLDCFRQIMAKEGIGGFYAGLIPRLGRVVPGQGIIFMSFEAIQTRIDNFVYKK